MAETIHQYTLTIPAGTPKASPATLAIPLPPCEIESVDLEVPPGPQGLMGFVLAVSGQQMIPFEVGQYIVWDNRTASWPLTDFPQLASWSLVGYNLDGVNAHSVVTRFHVNSLGQPLNVTPSLTVVSSPSPVGVLL